MPEPVNVPVEELTAGALFIDLAGRTRRVLSCDPDANSSDWALDTELTDGGPFAHLGTDFIHPGTTFPVVTGHTYGEVSAHGGTLT